MVLSAFTRDISVKLISPFSLVVSLLDCSKTGPFAPVFGLPFSIATVESSNSAPGRGVKRLSSATFFILIVFASPLIQDELTVAICFFSTESVKVYSPINSAVLENGMLSPDGF